MTQTILLEKIQTEINANGISKATDSFITKLMARKSAQEKLNASNLSRTAVKNSISMTPTAKSKALDSLDKEILASKTEIEILNEEIQAYSTKLTTGFDGLYVTDIQNQVAALPTGRADQKPSRIQGIREEAERNYTSRTSGGEALLKELRKSPTGIRASSLVTQPFIDTLTKKKDAADTHLGNSSPLPTDTTQKLVDISGAAGTAKATFEQDQDNRQNAGVKQGNPPNVSPGESFKQAEAAEKKEAKPGARPSAPATAIKGKEIEEYFFAPAVSNAEVIEIGNNPLRHGVKDTQFLEGDILDPRHIDFFVPQSYINPAPAYMSIVRNNSVVGNAKYTSRGKGQLPTLEAPFSVNKESRIYNQFSLTQTIEIYSEKFQVDDTMSEGNVVYFFGERPEIWTFSGTLLNDVLHAWHPKMRSVWHDQLRGSVLVKNKSHLAVIIPSSWLIIECYPIGLSISHTVDMENISPFTMSVFVKSAKTIPGLAGRLKKPDAKTPDLSAIGTSIEIAEILNDLSKQTNIVATYKQNSGLDDL